MRALALALARPDDPRIYRAFGVLYGDLGRADDAKSCLDEAIRLAR